MLVSAQAHPHAHMRMHTRTCTRAHAHTHRWLSLSSYSQSLSFGPVPHFLLLDGEGYTTFMLLSGSLPPSDKMILLSISWNSSLSISELLEEMLVWVSHKHSKSPILCSCIFSLPQFYELLCGPAYCPLECFPDFTPFRWIPQKCKIRVLP